MSEEKLDLILAELQSLNVRVTSLETNQQLMRDELKATQESMSQFLTKDDLKSFATKDDLKNFATKDDLKNFATKDDLKPIYEDLSHLKEEQSVIKQAVLETKEEVNEMKQNQGTFFEMIGEHEVSIRNIRKVIL